MKAKKQLIKTFDDLKKMVESGQDIFLTTGQVAELIGASPSYLKVLIQRGKIEAYRLGRQYRVKGSEVLKFFKKVTPTKVISTFDMGGPNL